MYTHTHHFSEQQLSLLAYSVWGEMPHPLEFAEYRAGLKWLLSPLKQNQWVTCTVPTMEAFSFPGAWEAEILQA